jgi:hypothetical protein
MATKPAQEKPFYLKVKFWYTLMAVGVFLALAMTETVEFSNDQVMTIILGLLGITSGAHALTDIAAIIASALRDRAQPQAGLGELGRGEEGSGGES